MNRFVLICSLLEASNVHLSSEIGQFCTSSDCTSWLHNTIQTWRPEGLGLREKLTCPSKGWPLLLPLRKNGICSLLPFWEFYLRGTVPEMTAKQRWFWLHRNYHTSDTSSSIWIRLLSISSDSANVRQAVFAVFQSCVIACFDLSDEGKRLFDEGLLWWRGMLDDWRIQRLLSQEFGKHWQSDTEKRLCKGYY